MELLAALQKCTEHFGGQIFQAASTGLAILDCEVQQGSQCSNPNNLAFLSSLHKV